MFNLRQIRSSIIEKFLKVLGVYNKRELTQKFIKRWLELLQIYSKLPNFQSFHCKIPFLDGLVPHAKSVLVVPFEDTQPPVVGNVSVFPLYPFRVYLRDKSICCKEGLELLQLYLDITNIKVIGFYRVGNYKKIMDSLKERKPKLFCYPPSLFKYFCLRNKALNGSFYSPSKVSGNSSKKSVALQTKSV
ncbi:hypothetical protein TNIN_179571 [Trichonephila inaurata madagascariensis]|uniref:Uncharacterized protein n=1 Tax=Trichonephila inaurata madagascariensis TaxID=2747483 RepID=A0A8X6YA74_9ARAC|nr:hypothetical protein TNIN_179571 [Trichonephila inaurata madagascariensis]